MRISANSRYQSLKAWGVAHLPTAFVVPGGDYRVARPRFTTAADIVSGVGGYKASGRWCRRGTTRLLYLSESPETATAESNEHARRYNLPLWQQMPKVIVAIRVETESVLDLTDRAVVAAL